jgi:hypothetical protein
MLMDIFRTKYLIDIYVLYSKCQSIIEVILKVFGRVPFKFPFLEI